MTACCLSLWGTHVSPYIWVPSHGRLFLIGFLSCTRNIPNCLPLTKIGAWSGVQHRGYIDVLKHYGDDGYPSNEDQYSLELDFLDTCVAKYNLGFGAWIRVRGRLVRSSDQYSQIGQPSVHRDMEPYTHMTLLYHHCHHLAIPYSRTTWFLRLHHHQFSQLHRLGHLFCMGKPRLHGVMSWDGYDDFPIAIGGIMRELEALRKRPDESVTSFISRWRENISQIIDKSSEQDQISMIMGLWANSSPSDLNGKKPGSGSKPSDVGTIGMMSHKSPQRPQTPRKFLDTPYPTIQHDQYRPTIATETSLGYQANLHCAYHRRVGHDTGGCAAKIETCYSNALVRALSQIRIDTSTTPEGLIHILTADRATCIVFSDDDLPLEGSGHIRPLYISVACSGHRVSTVLLDNDSALNVQVVSIEDDSRDMVPMSFDQCSSTLVTLLQRRMHITWCDCAWTGACTSRGGIDHISETVEIQDIQQALGQMHLSSGITEGSGVVIVAPLSPGRASMFSMCIPDEDFDYGLLMDSGGGPDEVTLDDAYTDEMDMMGIGCILNATLHRLHYMGMTITDVATSGFIFIEGASDHVDRPLSFDFMSGFVTCYDVMSNGNNNDMSLFKYLPVSQHFPLIAPQAPTAPMHDIDDVGDPDDPLSGKSDCDLDSEERKVTPVSGSTELIDLLRSYLDVFAWSYEDMPGLDPSIVQHHLPILPHYPEWLANVVPFLKRRQGHSMLSFMDGFFGYNQILMAPEDMEKTSFITEWGTYCYRVMPFGLKNARATYQRAATTLFHDMMHKDVEVYVDDMIVKSRDRAITRYRRFIARLIDICKPIFRLLRKNQPIVWNEDCQRAFEKIKECLLSPPVLMPPTLGSPLLLYLSVSDMALGCMLAQLDDSGKEQAIYYLSKRMLEYECKYIMIEHLCLALVWATRRLRHYMTEYSIRLVSRLDPLRYLFDRPVLTGRLMRWLVLLTEFDIQYVTQKSVKGSIVADHLASLLVSNDRPIDDDFPNEQFVSVASIAGWRLYFDGAANRSGFGIGILLISPQGDHILRESVLDALATLASMIEILARMTMRPILIETRFDRAELPWYHDIHRLWHMVLTRVTTAKDRRALRRLATRFVISGHAICRRSLDGMLLLCMDRVITDRVMREVHVGVCGPHMGGHMLARKIMRTSYFWLTMETDCCQFVQRCPECQMHGDLIHVPPFELHALTCPWPFSAWGVDVIGMFL
ncbi:hypothetical protein AAG906_039285 [Vitis piasezkii]